MKLSGYRIKSFLTEIRYPSQFRINNSAAEVLDLFVPEEVGFLSGGGVHGRNTRESNEFSIEFNRTHYLVENIENESQLDAWITKVSKLMMHVINKWEIKKILRLGIRFHVMVVDQESAKQKDYAQLLYSQLPSIQTILGNDANTAGFVVRSIKDGWDVRFGAFSSDQEVMTKYHKYVKPNGLFDCPCLVYDVDCSKNNIDVTGPQPRNVKLDIQEEIKKAHALAEDLVHKHVALLTAGVVK